MQNERNNEEQKTNLLNGVLAFLQKDKLVEFYKSPGRNFREQVKQTASFQDISEMGYIIYLDEMFIKRNREMYISIFEDIFETDLSILKNKLKTLNQTAIDQKFAFDRENEEIFSKALILWIKMPSVEQIAFDILSINEEDFKNRDLQKDLPIKSLDDLYKMIIKIVVSKSQARVDRIFDKINGGQIYDYELSTFDFYANESGKKFDECENREMAWLNLCATLVGNITNEFKNYQDSLPDFSDMGWGGCWQDWLCELYGENRVEELDDFCHEWNNKKGYVTVRGDLISICNTIKKIKLRKTNNQPIQKSRVELKMLGDRAKTLFTLWCFFNDLRESKYGELFNHFRSKKKLTKLSNQPDTVQNGNQNKNIYKEWQNKIKTKRNTFNQYLNSSESAMVAKNKSNASGKMSKQKYTQMYKALRLKKTGVNLEEFSQTYIHEIMYEIYEYVAEISSYELSESEMADYKILSDKIKSGQVNLNEDKDNNKNMINEAEKQKNNDVGVEEEKLENKDQQKYKKESYVKEESGQNSIRKISGQSPRITVSVIDQRMNQKNKDDDQNAINGTEKQENNNVSDLINHKKDTDQKEKSETSKKGIVETEIVNTTNGLRQNLLQQQNNITPLTNSQRNEEYIIDDEKNREPIIKVLSKTTELSSKKSPDIIENIAGCLDFDEVLKLYNEKKSDITDLIKNVQVNSLSTIAMFLWLLVHPWRWCKFFDIRNLARLKKIYNYEKAKNNSKKNGPQIVSLKEKIKDDKEKASNVKNPETEIRMDTHLKK